MSVPVNAQCDKLAADGQQSNGFNWIVVTGALGILSETFIYRQVRMFEQQVSVLTREHVNRQLFPEEGLEIVCFGQKRRSRADIVDALFRRLRRAYAYRYQLPRTARGAFEALVDGKPAKVVLVHYGPMALAVLDAAERLNVPVVAHFHGQDASKKLRQRVYQVALQRAWQRFAAVVTVSTAMTERLKMHGCPPEKIRQIPYGVEIPSAVQRRAGKDTCTYLHVGRLVEKKGITFSIGAFENVLRTLPNSRLVIVGAGPEEGRAKEVTRALGISKKVEFLGALPYQSVSEQMRKADVFIQHSVTADNGDAEGLPVSILEAQAHGLPVVATNHSGIPEGVVDGKTGMLCNERDVIGMAERMVRFGMDASLREQFGSAGRQHVIENFELSKQVNLLEEVLISVGRERRLGV